MGDTSRTGHLPSIPLCGFGALCLLWLVPLPVAAQPFDPAPDRLSILSWNVEWMFDSDTRDNASNLAREQSAPSEAYWKTKLQGVADVIAAARPHIVALQEIEGLQTLRALQDAIQQRHGVRYRFAFIPGTDTATEQDVGLLVGTSSGLIAYCRHEQSYTMFSSREYYNLSKHIVAHCRWSNVPAPLVLMNVHLRATAEAEEIRTRQIRLARQWMQPYLDSGCDVLILGDFNTEQAAGQATGDLVPLLSGPQPAMVDLLAHLPDPRTPTHLILPRQFDRAFASPSLIEDAPGVDWSLRSVRVIRQGVVRGQPDGESHWTRRRELPVDQFDLSDHYPILVELQLQ